MRTTLNLAAAAALGFLASGCTHATCSDYHQPGCWTQPPDSGSNDAEASDGSGDASDASVDDGAFDDAGDATSDDAAIETDGGATTDGPPPADG
jgi:hypothetical protein